MANGYSWSEMRDGGSYHLPGPQHLGWWATVAMLLSILLHVGVFVALDRMNIALQFEAPRQLSTGPMQVRQVEVQPLERETPATPEAMVIPPANPASLLEEVDLLAALPKDREIDLKPEIDQAEYALQIKNPAMQGDPAAIAMEVSAGLEVNPDVTELGRSAEQFKPAEAGQVTVDPGAVPQVDDLGKFTDDLLKRGVRDGVPKGALNGVASLDELLDLPPNILLGKKTLLPSDLLFEFNRAELRESAKVGLMKLALLMDRNPKMYCWIEGHTDLVGGDEFNLDLSIRRSEAVKTYLIKGLRMDASKIITRGFGRYEPLVTHGSTEQQAVNRRVEIRMRKAPPTKEQLKIGPKKADVIEEPPPPKAKPTATPKALLVKPKRALPVEDEPSPPRAKPAPLRATPFKEFPPLPDVPKAAPVEMRPDAPHAQAVEE